MLGAVCHERQSRLRRIYLFDTGVSCGGAVIRDGPSSQQYLDCPDAFQQQQLALRAGCWRHCFIFWAGPDHDEAGVPDCHWCGHRIHLHIHPRVEHMGAAAGHGTV